MLHYNGEQQFLLQTYKRVQQASEGNSVRYEKLRYDCTYFKSHNDDIHGS